MALNLTYVKVIGLRNNLVWKYWGDEEEKSSLYGLVALGSRREKREFFGESSKLFLKKMSK